MKRFNEQTGNEFERYMSRLEDDRNKNGFKTNYVETNKKLVSKYHKLSNPEKKLEIRNKLVMLNIKLAHEILYKKINLNTSRRDSVDILQEINLCLCLSVDKILKGKPRKVSTALFYLIMNQLGGIIKKYYDYSSGIQLGLNPDEITAEVEEEQVKVLDYIKNSYLSERECNILKECLNDNTSLEEIGYKYGLTKERVRQIKEKSIKKIRLVLDNRKRKEGIKTGVENEVTEFLKINHGIKYIIYYPIIEHKFFESYSDQSLLEKLIFRGIDLREWLIVDNKPREYYVDTIRCKKINHLLTTSYYEPNMIHNRNLKTLYFYEMKSEVFSMNTYYNFLLRISDFNEESVEKTLGSNYVTEYLQLNSIYGGDVSVINGGLARRAIIKAYLRKL